MRGKGRIRKLIGGGGGGRQVKYKRKHLRKERLNEKKFLHAN